uniref:(northern house mosquito) hypothetical protein n=1 Tax=Culex pipiens TaxID=7175 RepID=A0A8D8IAZ5_CULPI
MPLLTLLYFYCSYNLRVMSCLQMRCHLTRFWAASLQLRLGTPALSRSSSTWFNHRARCAPLRRVPTGSELNTNFTGLIVWFGWRASSASGILATCPAHLIRPALATFRILGLP